MAMAVHGTSRGPQVLTPIGARPLGDGPGSAAEVFARIATGETLGLTDQKDILILESVQKNVCQFFKVRVMHGASETTKRRLAKRLAWYLGKLQHAPYEPGEQPFREFLSWNMILIPDKLLGWQGLVLGANEVKASFLRFLQKNRLDEGLVDQCLTYTSPYLSYMIRPRAYLALAEAMPWLQGLKPKRRANVIAMMLEAVPLAEPSQGLPVVRVEASGDDLDMGRVFRLARVRFAKELGDDSPQVIDEFAATLDTLVRKARLADAKARRLLSEILDLGERLIDVSLLDENDEEVEDEVVEEIVPLEVGAKIAFVGGKGTVNILTRAEAAKLVPEAEPGSYDLLAKIPKPDQMDGVKALDEWLRQELQLEPLPEGTYWTLVAVMPETGRNFRRPSSLGYQGLKVLQAFEPEFLSAYLSYIHSDERSKVPELVAALSRVRVQEKSPEMRVRPDLVGIFGQGFLNEKTLKKTDGRFSGLVKTEDLAKLSWLEKDFDAYGIQIPGYLLKAVQRDRLRILVEGPNGDPEEAVVSVSQLSEMARMINVLLTDTNGTPYLSRAREWLINVSCTKHVEVLLDMLVKTTQRPLVYDPRLGTHHVEGLGDLPVVKAPVDVPRVVVLIRYPTFATVVAWAIPGPSTAICIGEKWVLKAVGGDTDGDTAGIIPVPDCLRHTLRGNARAKQRVLDEERAAAKAEVDQAVLGEDTQVFWGRIPYFLVGLVTKAWYLRWAQARSVDQLRDLVEQGDDEIKRLFDSKHLGASEEYVRAIESRAQRVLKNQADRVSPHGLGALYTALYGKAGETLPYGHVFRNVLRDVWGLFEGKVSFEMLQQARKGKKA